MVRLYVSDDINPPKTNHEARNWLIISALFSVKEPIYISFLRVTAQNHDKFYCIYIVPEIVSANNILQNNNILLDQSINQLLERYS
jgi:hypothetical protein